MDFTLPKVQEIELLLDGLAVGAEEAIYSVDDWIPRLRRTPTSLQFLEQMRSEWNVAIEAPNEECVQIMEVARAHLAGGHDGWPHLWAHILRVTAVAVTLAPEAEIDSADAFVLGILHDVGKLDEMRTGVSHELSGALFARKILGNYPDRWPKTQVERIANTIAKKSGNFDPFVMVLYDADKLDKIGATGIARRLSNNWGGLHTRFALRQVERELEYFPEMHYPTSRRLAESKMAFTETFIEQIRSVVSWL